MSKLIRNFISKLSGKFASRTYPLRHDLNVPISISFAPAKTTGKLTMIGGALSIKGQTKDLSSNGIAFIVDSIRLKEHYLVGENRVLNVELDLPNGKIAMQIIGQRYEQIGEHLSISKYLIGANIVDMSQIERDIYEEYLKFGSKRKKQIKSVLSLDGTNG